MGVTFDGATVNRRFMKLHTDSAELVYKVPNIYSSDGRFLYFFSDPPHLIKTVRNCFASKTRKLHVSRLIIIVHLLCGTLYMTLQHSFPVQWKRHITGSCNRHL